MAGLGALLYGWLADGEQQSWAAPPSESIHMDVEKDKMSKEQDEEEEKENTTMH